MDYQKQLQHILDVITKSNEDVSLQQSELEHIREILKDVIQHLDEKSDLDPEEFQKKSIV
jgi:hypothetical protein